MERFLRISDGDGPLHLFDPIAVLYFDEPSWMSRLAQFHGRNQISTWFAT
jgi:hypothetical protein